MPGLLFADNSSDAVNYGSMPALDDLAKPTFIAWIKPTNNSNTFRNWGGKGANTSLFRRGTDGTRLAISRIMSGNDPVVDIATGNVTTGWNFVAFTCDWLVSMKAYWGTPTTLATDKSFGAAVGTGSLTTDAAANMQLGANTNAAAPYTVAFFGVWNRIMALQEIQQQQFNLAPTSGCVLFSLLGERGAGLQQDRSPYCNHGTVVGATWSPLEPYRRRIIVPRRPWRDASKHATIVSSTRVGARSLRLPRNLGVRCG